MEIRLQRHGPHEWTRLNKSAPLCVTSTEADLPRKDNFGDRFRVSPDTEKLLDLILTLREDPQPVGSYESRWDFAE